MYELLSPIDDGLDVFATEFEEHLTNTSLAVMQSLQGENVRTHYSIVATTAEKLDGTSGMDTNNRSHKIFLAKFV